VVAALVAWARKNVIWLAQRSSIRWEFDAGTMRIAMTGGGGFIGSHLLSRMVAAGMDVTLIGASIGRSRYTASVVASGGVRFLCCDQDFRQRDILRRAMDDADVLVLLGYVMPASAPTGSRLLAEVERNVAPLARLLEAAQGRRHHAVFASSLSVYGASSRVPVHETDAPAPETPYAMGKLACEETIRVLAKSAGWTACVLRYARVYGPGETVSRTIPSLIRAALADQPVALRGDALDEHDYVHVADAVSATMRALAEAATGTYNIGTGIGTRTADLADLVFRLAGARAIPIRDAVEVSDGAPRLVAETEVASAKLGFTAQRGLEEGLAEEIGWFRSLLTASSTEEPTVSSSSRIAARPTGLGATA